MHYSKWMAPGPTWDPRQRPKRWQVSPRARTHWASMPAGRASKAAANSKGNVPGSRKTHWPLNAVLCFYAVCHPRDAFSI